VRQSRPTGSGFSRMAFDSVRVEPPTERRARVLFLISGHVPPLLRNFEELFVTGKESFRGSASNAYLEAGRFWCSLLEHRERIMPESPAAGFAERRRWLRDR
jgi:hypothetical protein